jgi:hypothetical protein
VERYYKRNSKTNSGKGWQLLNLKPNELGYLRININGIYYSIQRLIAFCFLELENIVGSQSNDYGVIDHINGIKTDNRVENLRLITVQQNTFNKHDVKGYSWNIHANKWKGSICVDGLLIHLGYFDTEQEAHAAYLDAKAIHHII